MKYILNFWALYATLCFSLTMGMSEWSSPWTQHFKRFGWKPLGIGITPRLRNRIDTFSHLYKRVCPSVSPSHTSWNHRKRSFLAKIKIGNGKIHESMTVEATLKWCKFKNTGTGTCTSTRENVSLVRTPTCSLWCWSDDVLDAFFGNGACTSFMPFLVMEHVLAWCRFW